MKVLSFLLLFATTAFAQVTKFTINLDPDAAFTGVQEYAHGKLPLEVLTAAQTVPATENLGDRYQANTVASYTENFSPNVNVVGVYSQIVCRNGGACWGGNDLVEDKTPEGQEGGIIFGREINVQTFNPSTKVAIGLLINGNGTHSPDNSFGVIIGPIGQLRNPKQHFRYGFVCDNDAVDVCHVIYPTSNAPTANSGIIRFYARSNGNYISVTMYATPDGRLNVNGRLY
jgi:hypothetical protein